MAITDSDEAEGVQRLCEDVAATLGIGYDAEIREHAARIREFRDATFGGTDLYSSLAEKAAALDYSLALNHPFVDGNKRVAHATLETFLILNGRELDATVDDAERTMLALAAAAATSSPATASPRSSTSSHAGRGQALPDSPGP